MRHVVVLGAGAAGTAAALAARAAGATVTLVDGGSGASTLSTGAIDLTQWDATATMAPITPRAASILKLLDLYAVPDRGVEIVTTAGILRPARGADCALLDVSSCSQGVILVPRSDHPAWDATTLARTWSDSARARARGLSFVAADATLTRFVDERAMPDADLAARHDDPDRLAWLGDRLRDLVALSAASSAVAVVLPPWLGLDRPRASALSQRVGLPCGEASSLPGGPSGLRFERARDRAFARVEIDHVRARALTLLRSTTDDRWRAKLDDTRVLSADAVIVAVGGLLGGGLAYTPSAALHAGELPSAARATFVCSIAGPFTIGANSRPIALPGSLFGASPESLAWPLSDDPLLERAGILSAEDGRVNHEAGLFAAGDIVADRRRTWLEAFVAGERAGVAAVFA